MYDEKHRVIRIPLSPEEQIAFRQKGLYEKLLCKGCEQWINRFENYVEKMFYHEMQYLETAIDNEIQLVNLDYAKFKLFQLSVLWRASVSSLAFFDAVNLGPHEETIRQMLLKQTPGKPHEYGCVMFGVNTEETGSFDAITDPERGRLDGHIAYRFLFGSCGWVFIVSSHSSFFERKKFFVQEDGTLILRLFPAKNIPFIRGLVNDLKKRPAGRT